MTHRSCKLPGKIFIDTDGRGCLCQEAGGVNVNIPEECLTVNKSVQIMRLYFKRRRLERRSAKTIIEFQGSSDAKLPWQLRLSRIGQPFKEEGRETRNTLLSLRACLWELLTCISVGCREPSVGTLYNLLRPAAYPTNRLASQLVEINPSIVPRDRYRWS